MCAEGILPEPEPTPVLDKTLREFLGSMKFSAAVLAIMWLVHIYTIISGVSLTRLGVFPRELDGSIGILFAPLIHGSWEHLFSNSAPLFFALSMIYIFYKRVALSSFFLIYFLTGAAVWMFGRSVYHIGASGVVYGLLSFIFWSGVFRRNIKSIVLALIVTMVFFGYLEGIVPFQEGISWESHLLGLIVGIIIAFFLKGIIEKDEVHRDPWAAERDDTAEFFLPRDAFEKTIEQKQQEWNNSDTTEYF